ncbi:MAG: diacylglycerol kinase family protein [Clostridia bacterium]|nr:diacylglycerol kinase family protein [Clostridia bacterium]
MKYAILYNPHSCGENGLKIAREIENLMQGSFTYHDLTELDSLNNFIESLPEDTGVVLTGGDGSLNSFVNNIDTSTDKKIYFYASGSGNDFARDIGFKKRTKPIIINDYIKNLPTALINGKTYKFLNCVGSGMDGYCCGEVERLRALSKRRGNYLYAAIKALLFAYKPCTAYVTVDGEEYRFENTWLVPTMNGRFFGGGFMAAPTQDRLNADSTLSLVAMHSKNFFKIVTAFLLIMKGKHTIMKSMIKVIKGHEISVKLSRSATLQIDGETIPDVTEYTVSSAKKIVKA